MSAEQFRGLPKALEKRGEQNRGSLKKKKWSNGDPGFQLSHPTSHYGVMDRAYLFLSPPWLHGNNHYLFSSVEQ